MYACQVYAYMQWVAINIYLNKVYKYFTQLGLLSLNKNQYDENTSSQPYTELAGWITYKFNISQLASAYSLLAILKLGYTRHDHRIALINLITTNWPEHF